MKKAGRRFHRIFRAVFAAALALAITGANLAPAAAVTWADVNELKDEANGLDAEKKELQAKLDALALWKSEKTEDHRGYDLSHAAAELGMVCGGDIDVEFEVRK